MAQKFARIDKSFPFFAYGLFKPDELAYHQIKKYIDKSTPLMSSF